MKKKPTAEDILKEFVEDVKAAYPKEESLVGIGGPTEVSLADEWPDLEITFQKAVKYLKKRKAV